jgi:hypothetical protein
MSNKYTALELKDAKIKKTKAEEAIIGAMMSGKKLNEMDDDALRYVADQIILKGAAIYGCGVPDSELFASVLSKEIIAFFLEFGYEDVTLSEIMLALNLNLFGKVIPNPLGEDLMTIEFKGNFIHVSFLANVLKNYSVLKTNLMSKLKNYLSGY